MLILATYRSSQAALRAEQRFKAAGVAVELIPVPRQIKSTCGFCLLVEEEGHEDLVQTGVPEGLWRVLEPLPGSLRRRYEPFP